MSIIRFHFQLLPSNVIVDEDVALLFILLSYHHNFLYQSKEIILSHHFISNID